jgi:hypothetical protein
MAANGVAGGVPEVSGRLEAVTDRLENQRETLSKNQLKKLRKKRSRLAHQVKLARRVGAAGGKACQL